MRLGRRGKMQGLWSQNRAQVSASGILTHRISFGDGGGGGGGICASVSSSVKLR